MSIRPVDLGGMIQRTDDVGLIKHREDEKPMTDQQNIQVRVDKREDNLAHQVQQTNNTEEAKNQADAKDEGRNQYKKRDHGKKTQKKKDASVTKKDSSGGFDIRI